MTLRHLLTLVLLICLPHVTAQAETTPSINDAAALKGVAVGKGVFLIDFTDPGKTAFYLEIIRGTHAGMRRQGVTPDFVVVYIGPTVRFLSRQPDFDLEMQHGDNLKAVAEQVAGLHELGVRQEVCAIATRVFKVANESLLPGLSLVGDGFISLIGWQSQGYRLVPLF